MSSRDRSGDRSRDSGTDTRNPCDGTCRFDAAGECRGCHRTKPEVKGWKRLSDAAKAAINQRLRARHAATKPGAKRRRKLDRKIAKLEARLAALRAERELLAGPPPAIAVPARLRAEPGIPPLPEPPPTSPRRN